MAWPFSHPIIPRLNFPLPLLTHPSISAWTSHKRNGSTKKDPPSSCVTKRTDAWLSFSHFDWFKLDHRLCKASFQRARATTTTTLGCPGSSTILCPWPEQNNNNYFTSWASSFSIASNLLFNEINLFLNIAFAWHKMGVGLLVGWGDDMANTHTHIQHLEVIKDDGLGGGMSVCVCVCVCVEWKVARLTSDDLCLIIF